MNSAAIAADTSSAPAASSPEVGAAAAELAALIDAQPGLPHQREIVRARSAVERAASLTLDRVGRALGPGPMCMDPAHARRWADLTVFIRQSHADRDWQHLGNLMHREGRTWTL